MPQATAPKRFVSVAEFRQRTDLSTSTVYRLLDRGLLARPSRVSPGRVGWPSEYIDNWLAARSAPQQVAV